MKLTEQQLDRLIKITIALIVIVVLASAGVYFYYYKKPAIGKQSIADQQIVELQKRVAEKPRDATARFYLAQAYMRKKLWVDGIAELKQVLKLEPKAEQAYFYLGFAYKEKGDINLAIKNLNKVIDMSKGKQFNNVNPNLKTSYFFLGEIDFDRKQYKKALDYFVKSSKVGNVDSDALKKIGDCYYQLKQYSKAESNFKEALRFVPSYAEAHYGLGLTYLKLNKKSEAKKSFQSAVKNKPSYKLANEELDKLK